MKLQAQPLASISSPPARAPAKKKASVLGVAAAILILAVNIGWYLWLGKQLALDESVEAARSMTNAEKLMVRVLRDSRRGLEARATMIADDARLRAAVPVPEMDEATMTDLLQDIAIGSRSRLVALLGPDGAVRAVAGKDKVEYGSLATTAVFRRATSSRGAVSGLWILADHPFHVALAPVRFGENEVLAYVLVGEPLSRKRLQMIEQVTGVSTAIGTGDRVLLASTDDPVRKSEIELALGDRPPSSPAIIVQKDSLEEAGTPAPVQQLFVLATAPAPVRALLWLPVLTAMIGTIAALAVARR